MKKQLIKQVIYGSHGAHGAHGAVVIVVVVEVAALEMRLKQTEKKKHDKNKITWNFILITHLSMIV